VAWLRRLDVRRSLDYVDFTSEWDTVARTHASLAYDDCVRAMHVVAPMVASRQVRWFPHTGTGHPPLWPLLPLLYVPACPNRASRVRLHRTPPADDLRVASAAATPELIR